LGLDLEEWLLPFEELWWEFRCEADISVSVEEEDSYLTFSFKSESMIVSLGIPFAGCSVVGWLGGSFL
jgi:hypothetical protein